MAKIGPKEIQSRALHEARLKSSRGSRESRPASEIASWPLGAPKAQVVKAVAIEAQSPEQGRGIVSGAADKVAALPAGVAPGPRETKKTTHQYRDPEKRKAYMRDYMKKRRIAEAEQRQKAKQ